MEEAGGEERVELGAEVAAVGGLRHAEARHGAAEGHDVVRADRDGDAVAELGAGLERLSAAEEARHLDGVGLRAESLQQLGIFLPTVEYEPPAPGSG